MAYCYSSVLRVVLCSIVIFFEHLTQQLKEGEKMVHDVLEQLDKLIYQLRNINGKL